MNRLTAIIEKLQKTAIATWFAAKYPRLSQFILNRLFAKKFNGLPLTFLTIVFGSESKSVGQMIFRYL